MKQRSDIPHRRTHCATAVAGALAIGTFSIISWAANDLDTPTAKAGLDTNAAAVHNTKWLGHNDLQGRVTYQTTVHTYPNGRVIAFAGHFNANPSMVNPLTGVAERNGTSLVDVTDPRNPVYLQHIPADKGGARMNMLCDGSVLPHGVAGHVYLLRENGAVSHEVWDVTDPVHSTLVSTPVQGLDVTHRSWWDCRTGIAYIVGGATKSKTAPDGWNPNSSPNQHLKIFDLSDPTKPDYIMDFGYPGQNPGSTFVMPGTENTTKTVPPGVHGPIVVSTLQRQCRRGRQGDQSPVHAVRRRLRRHHPDRRPDEDAAADNGFREGVRRRGHRPLRQSVQNPPMPNCYRARSA